MGRIPGGAIGSGPGGVGLDGFRGREGIRAAVPWRGRRTRRPRTRRRWRRRLAGRAPRPARRPRRRRARPIGQHGTHHTAPGIQHVQHALQFRPRGLSYWRRYPPTGPGSCPARFPTGPGPRPGWQKYPPAPVRPGCGWRWPRKGVIRDGFHCLKGYGGVVVPLRAVLYLPAGTGHGEAAENGMDRARPARPPRRRPPAP